MQLRRRCSGSLPFTERRGRSPASQPAAQLTGNGAWTPSGVVGWADEPWEKGASVPRGREMEGHVRQPEDGSLSRRQLRGWYSSGDRQ
ncbi:hypothetical protein NDU88_007257 [Pleurodeles waltl]|uniref:Uncharacterized protein n=1 Tax=Pleurodeles waltl TaxID=8319 RepID=A0AAV7N4V1_PLEWA|nr:hypothetical protein NDU88_007257 [Pleurodeles waltl]